MEKLLSTIVKDFDTWTNTYDIDMGDDIRQEVEAMEAEIEEIKETIKKRKALALELGKAVMLDPPSPQKRVPDVKTYIKLHGQEAFDNNHKLTEPRPRFAWIQSK